MLKRRAVDGDGETCLAESASLGGGSLSERRALNRAKARRPESEGMGSAFVALLWRLHAIPCTRDFVL